MLRIVYMNNTLIAYVLRWMCNVIRQANESLNAYVCHTVNTICQKFMYVILTFVCQACVRLNIF